MARMSAKIKFRLGLAILVLFALVALGDAVTGEWWGAGIVGTVAALGLIGAFRLMTKAPRP
jgi:hypothetical protein